MARVIATLVRLALCVLLTAGQCLVTACSGGGSPTSPTSTTPPSGSGGSGGSGGTGPGSGTTAPAIAGTYTLTAVNGQAVPALFDAVNLGGGARMEMRAMRGHIIVNADGTYLEEVETQLRGTMLPADRIDVVQQVGLWTLSGTTITFSPYQRSPLQAALVSGRIEIVTRAPGLDGTLDSVTWEFRR